MPLCVSWPRAPGSVRAPSLPRTFDSRWRPGETLSPTPSYHWPVYITRVRMRRGCVPVFPRCPQGVRPSLQASPSVVGRKRLGGVDQATLRQSLSKRREVGGGRAVQAVEPPSQEMTLPSGRRSRVSFRCGSVADDGCPQATGGTAVGHCCIRHPGALSNWQC